MESEEMNMLTFLDLLVGVFVGMCAFSLLALCLMFMVRNRKIRKGCFYVVIALGIYAATVGFRIGSFGGFMFPMQAAISWTTPICGCCATAWPWDW